VLFQKTLQKFSGSSRGVGFSESLSESSSEKDGWVRNIFLDGIVVNAYF
jgi:hypothetical protein